MNAMSRLRGVRLYSAFFLLLIGTSGLIEYWYRDNTIEWSAFIFIGAGLTLFLLPNLWSLKKKIGAMSSNREDSMSERTKQIIRVFIGFWTLTFGAAVLRARPDEAVLLIAVTSFALGLTLLLLPKLGPKDRN